MNLFSRSRYGYYTSRVEYYTSLIEEKTPSQLLSLLNNKQDFYPTNQELGFERLELGMDKETAIPLMGRPKFVWKNPSFKQHEARVYRFNIQHIFCYAILHFLSDQLFLITTVFKKLSSKNTERILDIVEKKYLNSSEKKSIEGIYDPKGNALLIDHNHYLSIKYVGGNSVFKALLTCALEQKQVKKSSHEGRLNALLAEYL